MTVSLSNTSEMDIPVSTSKIVNMINYSLAKHSYASIACLLLADGISIYSVHALLVLLDVTFPVGFAVAFAVSRPLKRFRYDCLLLIDSGPIGFGVDLKAAILLHAVW